MILQVRLGIATGLAVVGDLIGEGAAQERGVVGETPNLAARLQGLAEPNTLVIAEARAGRSAGCSTSPISGRKRLPALPSRNRAWRVVGESGDVEPLRGVALGRRRRSSAATRKSSCCCAAGSRRRAAKGGWC